jgi:hypothetical protein
MLNAKIDCHPRNHKADDIQKAMSHWKPLINYLMMWRKPYTKGGRRQIGLTKAPEIPDNLKEHPHAELLQLAAVTTVFEWTGGDINNWPWCLMVTTCLLEAVSDVDQIIAFFQSCV